MYSSDVGRVAFVADYAALRKFWKDQLQARTERTIGRIYVETPLTKPQFARLGPQLQAKIQDAVGGAVPLVQVFGSYVFDAFTSGSGELVSEL